MLHLKGEDMPYIPHICTILMFFGGEIHDCNTAICTARQCDTFTFEL